MSSHAIPIDLSFTISDLLIMATIKDEYSKTAADKKTGDPKVARLVGS